MSALPSRPDLIVFSHLRWTWVWQRPQHLVTRLARLRAGSGARTYFVEEPVSRDVPAPVLHRVDRDGVTMLCLEVPAADGRPEFLGFDHPVAARYGELLAEFLTGEKRFGPPDVWLATPMAADHAAALGARMLIYDVMDDLASFDGAPAGLTDKHLQVLTDADLVLTGGRSLHRSVLGRRTRGTHLFRSGVERHHWLPARNRPAYRGVSVAGYLGVVDERLDLGLVRDLADHLPDWVVRLTGPVTKIDPTTLPQAPNIEYLPLTDYDLLPRTLAGFDVAIMPFAANRATRSISPTKTLEYLAAGLPVVSTPIADVIADFGSTVRIADGADDFATCCRAALQDDRQARERDVEPLLAGREWDDIAAAAIDRLLLTRPASDGRALR